MVLPTISIQKETDHMLEIMQFADMTVYLPYAIDGYPEKKIYHGTFIQIYKGMKRAEGPYVMGEKHGVWSYYMHNPHHPLSREYFDNGRKTKQEILYPDGHNIRVIFMYDETEKITKQIHYAEDGKTVTKLDIYQDGILKEENKVTEKGQEQTVYLYDSSHLLVEKHHFVNDRLIFVEKAA